MRITGELLKSERINLKLSIQDVASTLKLSSKIINAIEAGNADALPSKTFVRGFVKSYAQLLKLDADAVLRQFLEEMGSTNPLPKIPPPMPLPNENNIKALRPALKHTAQNYSVKNSSLQTTIFKDGENKKNIFLMLLIASVLIVVLIISNKIIDRFNGDPVASAPVVENHAPEVTPNIGKEPLQINNANQAPPASSPISSDATPAKIDLNAISTENGFEKSSAKPVEVLLEAKKNTEIFYGRGDSKQLVPLKLTANQIQVLRSDVGLHLRVIDSSAIKINVNGVNKILAPGNNKEVKLTF